MKHFCLFLIFALLFTGACSSMEPSSIPLSASESVRGTPTIPVIDTATLPSRIPDNSAPEIHNSLPTHKDYIIYIKSNSISGQDEIWALNPEDNSPILVVSGADLWPWGWSPSGSHWLFTAGSSILVANSNGTAIHSVFNDKRYTQIYPFWLTDTTLLFNAYTDLLLAPDIYELDLTTGKSTRISTEAGTFIQSVFPPKGSWLQVVWDSGHREILERNLNGDITEYFSGFDVSIDPFWSCSFQFIRNSNETVFMAKNKGDENTDYRLWKMNITSGSTEVLFKPSADSWVDEFLLSPNEQYLAFTYLQSQTTFLNILNITTGNVDYQWNYPYWLNSSGFLWSPDSNSIALPYVSGEPGTIPKVDHGIQVMDITSGETRVLLNENIVKIVDWHFVK